MTRLLEESQFGVCDRMIVPRMSADFKRRSLEPIFGNGQGESGTLPEKSELGIRGCRALIPIWTYFRFQLVPNQTKPLHSIDRLG